MNRTAIFLIISFFSLIAWGQVSSDTNSTNQNENSSVKEQIKEIDNKSDEAKTLQESNTISKDNSQPLINNDYFVQENDRVLGNKDSKIVFVEYFSPTCPHCSLYHQKIFPHIKKKYIDNKKIAYVIREFIANKQDLDASILAHCAGNNESYLNFTDVILKQQNSWAYNKNYRDILTNISTIGGVSPEKYATCLQDEAMIEKIVSHTKTIVKNPKFVGTPTFFVNGKMVKKYTAEELSDTIDQEIKIYEKSKQV